MKKNIRLVLCAIFVLLMANSQLAYGQIVKRINNKIYAETNKQSTLNGIQVGLTAAEYFHIPKGPEIVKYRTPTAKLIQMDSNTIKAFVSTSPIHYLDENGTLQDIDLKVEKNQTGNGPIYQSVKNTVKAYWYDQEVVIGDDKYKYHVQNASLQLSEKSGISKTITSYTTSGNILNTLKAGNITERYEVLPGMVRQSIIISKPLSKDAKVTYSYSIKPENNTSISSSAFSGKSTNSGLDILDETGNKVGNIQHQMTDASGKVIDSEWFIEDAKGHSQVIIVIDANLLPEDPGLYPILSSSITSTNDHSEVSVFSDGTRYSGNVTCGGGATVNNVTIQAARGYFKFTLPTLPTNYQVYDARLASSSVTYSTSLSTTAYLSYCTVDWSTSNVIYNQACTQFNSFGITSSSNFSGIDVKSAVSNWYGGTSNYGMQLKTDACNDTWGYTGMILTIEMKGKYNIIVFTGYQPSNWSGPIVVTKTLNGTTGATTFNAGDQVYINAAIKNNTDYNITSKFNNTIYDGSLNTLGSWETGSLNGQSFSTLTNIEYKVPVGTTFIYLGADVNDAISEDNEYDNTGYVVIYGNRPPTCGLTSPSDGATEVPVAPVFSWNGSDPDDGEPAAYRIQISSTKDFATADIIHDEWFNNNSETWTYSNTLARNKTYYWKMKARDKDNSESSWTAAWSFTTTSKIKIHVSGTLKYRDENYSDINQINLSNIRVQFADINQAIPTLIGTYTDANGNFDFGEYLFEASPNPLYKLYVNFENQYNLCVIRDGADASYSTMQAIVPEQTGLSVTADGHIYFNTELENVFDNNDPNTNPALASCYIYSAITKTNEFLVEEAYSPLPGIDIYYCWNQPTEISRFVPENNILGTGYIILSNRPCVYDQEGNTYGGYYGSAPYHEYAHYFMYRYFLSSDGSRYGFPEGAGVTFHTPSTLSNPGNAITEGWAEFMPCAVTKDQKYLLAPGSTGAMCTIENNDWHKGSDGKSNASNIDGDKYEGAVASILWDIYDNTIGDVDETSGSMNRFFQTIWDVFRVNIPEKIYYKSKQPEGLREYYDAWKTNAVNPQLQAFQGISLAHGYNLITLDATLESGTATAKVNQIMYRQDIPDANLQATVCGLDNGIVPHSGDYMYKITGEDYSSSPSYVYWKMFDTEIPMAPQNYNQSGRYLSFWIYVPSPNVGRVGLDLVTAQKGNVRDYLNPYGCGYVVDQNGKRIHPATRTVPTDQWVHYVYDLTPLYRVINEGGGQTLSSDDIVTQVLVAYDDGGATEIGAINAYIDDIEIKEYRFPVHTYGSVLDANTVKLQWIDNNDDEDGFIVEYTNDRNNWSNTPVSVASIQGVGGIGEVTISGLSGIRNYFRVKSKKGDQISAYEARYAFIDLALPAKPYIDYGRIFNDPGEKPILNINVTINSYGGSVNYFDIERKTGLNGVWQSIYVGASVGGYTANVRDEVDFSADYYYRATAYNGIGKSEYSDELKEQIYFVTPQLLGVTADAGSFHVEWKDSMGTIEYNGGSIGYNSFYDAMVFYYKKATDIEWQYSYIIDDGRRSEWDVIATLTPMATYNIKIARVWHHGVLTYTPFSPTVDIFIPQAGYTNNNNARRLFRAGDNTLNAAFYDDSQIRLASSTNNGLSWSMNNPGINGARPTISEKTSNNSIYMVRASGNDLLFDSLGIVTGLNKVIATGKKKHNPAIAVDNIGNIHCVWAETTLTEKVIEHTLSTEYHKFDTIRIYYAKKTATGWEAPRIIYPIQSDSTDRIYVSLFSGDEPGFPPINIPKPSIVISYSGSTVIPQIAWEHQQWNYVRDLSDYIWVCDTQLVYCSKNLLTGEAVSPLGYIAENPCLGVNTTGTIALTYQQNGDIYRRTNNGSTWSTPYNVSNNTGNSQMPTVAYDKGGVMHILWHDNSDAGFTQKTSTLPVGTDAKLALTKLTELPPGEESIVWEDIGDVAIDTLNPTIAKVSSSEILTTTVNATQIFYRRYKDNAWSPIYRLTASVEPSIYPSLPLTDNAAQMGFIWTEGSGVKYKRLPDLDKPTVAVTFPNGGEVLYSGRRYNITWSSADNRGIKEYALYYTANYIAQDDPTVMDAVTLWRSVATIAGGLNYYSWRVPYNVTSTNCRFKVVAYDSSGNAATDISDKSFTIKSRDIIVVETDKAIAYNNAGKIARSSDGLLHVCYNGIDSVYYMASSDDGQTWATSLTLDKGSLPTIVTDSKNLPAMAWIKQWDNIAGGGVFFSRQTAAGWTAPETLAYMHGVSWDYIGGYSPPAMTIKNDTISLVYEYSYGGGIPPHIAKGWRLQHTRFAINNIAAKKDTVIDSYLYIIEPPIWKAPASASIATDYKGYDHISWHRANKIYYRMRKPDSNYGNILQLSGPGIAQNPCISISGVASAVWEEDGDIYQRTGFDQKWESTVNISASGASSMMPYICGSDVLWTEDVLSDYEVYLSSYSTAKMTYDVSENLSCTDYASIFPHETKMQTNDGTKTYRIWAEEIEPEVLWGITFMADTTELEPTYALDAGQAEPSIFTVQRDGYITYGTVAKSEIAFTEPFKTVDYDTTALIYSFDNFDPAKKYKITLSFYHETGQEIKLKPIVNKIPLGEVKVTSGKEEVLDKPLSEASYKDGQITLTIEKVKGPIAVCGKILIYENPQGNGHGGTQMEEITSITPNYINKLYQNCPNPFSHKTSFNYQIKNQGLVTFKIYNALGQLVKTLVNEPKPAGVYQVDWDGKDGSGLKVSSGVYIYRLQTGDFMDTKKMVVIK